MCDDDKQSNSPADKCQVIPESKNAMVLLYEAEQRKKKRDEKRPGIEFQETYFR